MDRGAGPVRGLRSLVPEQVEEVEARTRVSREVEPPSAFLRVGRYPVLADSAEVDEGNEVHATSRAECDEPSAFGAVRQPEVEEVEAHALRDR